MSLSRADTQKIVIPNKGLNILRDLKAAARRLKITKVRKGGRGDPNSLRRSVSEALCVSSKAHVNEASHHTLC